MTMLIYTWLLKYCSVLQTIFLAIVVAIVTLLVLVGEKVVGLLNYRFYNESVRG